MAVTIKEKNDYYTEFKFDNGDIKRLNEVIEKWNFKDPQSFFRFVISIMLVTEDKFLAILENSEAKAIKPASEYMKGI